MEKVEKYASMAQRVASSYLRSLAEGGDKRPEQRDLRGFFLAFYTALYEHPEQFGLPLTEDDLFMEGEANGTGHKTELNKKRKKPQDLILAGLDFLMTAGCSGQLEGQALALDEETAAQVKKVRSLRIFLQGLSAAGLQLVEVGGSLRLENPTYPAMMPTLKALAQACAVYPNTRLGAFHFARCDFRALQPGYIPDPLDLYRIFPAADYERRRRCTNFSPIRNTRQLWKSRACMAGRSSTRAAARSRPRRFFRWITRSAAGTWFSCSSNLPAPPGSHP